MHSRPVLIVDDERMVRETLSEALLSGGYVVDSACSAAQALEKMADRDYAVVLTDMNMPGGPSGLDLLSEIKSRYPLVMVIIITAYGTLDIAVSALKRGAYDFIQKPFKIREIEMVLDRALDHARVLRELEEYHQELEARVLARTEEFRSFHEAVLHLNDITLEAAGARDPAAVAAPFATFLEQRFLPDGLAVLVPAEGAWRLLLGRPEAGWPPLEDIPSPGAHASLLETKGSTFPEIHFLPLSTEDPRGALLLGFRRAGAFHPEDPALTLCCRQLAALLRTRPVQNGRAPEP
ncbi:MAG: response regulator [Acidobacteria bacterium]|nr:response regulator [Acidobacteriota bacterium]